LNTKELIESGILESYVLGLATEEEQHEINQNVLTNSGFADYLVTFEKNVQGYFLQNAVPPPTAVREIIQRRTGKTDIEKAGVHTYYNISEDTKKKETFLDIEVNDTYIKVHKWWRPAFVAIFILSKIFLIAGLYYYFKASSQQEEIEKLKIEISAQQR
jgi:hypothetical protein